MKLPFQSRIFVAVLTMLGASAACAQNAALTSDATTLAAKGGVVTLTASITYDTTPGAVAWSIALPADWELVSVAGPNVPAIAPEPGSTGTLEFAYTSVPVDRAQFSVQVRYPANTAPAKAAPTVLVRSGGKLTTLTPPAVDLQGVRDGSAAERSRN